MKKILLLVIAILLSVANTFAQGGTTGPLTWQISNDTLYISGEGAMPDYDDYYGMYAPWIDYMNAIFTLVIGDSVNRIGNDAFYQCVNLTSIYFNFIIPPDIAPGAFYTPLYIPVYIPCNTYQDYVGLWGGYFVNIIDLNPEPKLCMIYANANNYNEIVWNKDRYVSSYLIYREGSQTDQYDKIATVNYNELNKYIDTESNPMLRSYHYKISAVDIECGETILSESHKTIHLTINSGQNNSWNLMWTHYEGVEYSTYNIYRTSGATLGELELIHTISANNNSYSDFNAPEGYVYYIIEIVLNEGCEIGKSVSSIRSNVATNNPNVSVNEIKQKVYEIYPNPVSSILNVKMDNSENVDYAICNNLGQVVIRGILDESKSINVGLLSNGIYFLKIDDVISKIVKY